VMMAKASWSATEPLLRTRVLKAALNQFGQSQYTTQPKTNQGFMSESALEKTKRKPL
jgi:hypothetical protein